MFLRVLVILIVLAGVVVTAFSLRSSPPATESEVDALRRLGIDATADMQQRLEEVLAARATSEEGARLDSPLGQALSRQCVEWSELNTNHPSPEIAANRDRACDQLQDWVRNGVEPDRPPRP